MVPITAVSSVKTNSAGKIAFINGSIRQTNFNQTKKNGTFTIIDEK